MPDCTARRFEFQGPGRRQIVAEFTGGQITSDGGVMLLGEVDRRRRVVERFASCFEDRRDPDRIEHTVEELLRQRLYALRGSPRPLRLRPRPKRAPGAGPGARLRASRGPLRRVRRARAGLRRMAPQHARDLEPRAPGHRQGRDHRARGESPLRGHLAPGPPGALRPRLRPAHPGRACPRLIPGAFRASNPLVTQARCVSKQRESVYPAGLRRGGRSRERGDCSRCSPPDCR